MAIIKPTRIASFRGVAFKVFTSDTEFGRRVVEHEFVKRDEPYQEDLGRRARQFSIEAFVTGNNVDTQRDALIAACETPGPGILIHPYYGNRNVIVKTLRVREAAGEQGLVRFNIDFSEAGQLMFPTSKIDPASKLESAAADLQAASEADFVNKFSVLGQPQFVVDSARAKVQEFADFLGTTSSSISNSSSAITDFDLSVRQLKAEAGDLINTPATLYGRLAESIASLKNLAVSKEDAAKLYSKFYDYGQTDVINQTPTISRQQQQLNQGALNNSIIQESLANGATESSQIAFKSVEDANASRQSLFDTIENQENTTTDDDVYAALLSLRARVAQAIPPQDESLPFVVSIDLGETTPSLSLSYQLYESLDREQDIIDRNAVSNPAFLPAGEPLMVLKDG